MTQQQEDELLLWGGGLFLGYLLLKQLGAFFSPSGPPATAIGSALQAIFNPSGYHYTPGITLVVTFPDGLNHAVDPAWLDSNNQFTWPPPTGDGQSYTLVTGASGAHAAYLTNSSLIQQMIQSVSGQML
jgi:hypothetical protein